MLLCPPCVEFSLVVPSSLLPRRVFCCILAECAWPYLFELECGEDEALLDVVGGAGAVLHVLDHTVQQVADHLQLHSMLLAYWAMTKQGVNGGGGGGGGKGRKSDKTEL